MPGRIGFGLAALVMATAGAVMPGALAAGSPATPTQCKPAERVLYSCAFPRGVGSLCAGGDRVHYRFGPRGRPKIDLASRPDWSNVRLGEVRGQGNGHQRHLRISQGRFQYIVFEGMDGELTQNPGHAYSGIAVMEGEREATTLSCPGRAIVALQDPLLDRRATPEETDGPFDMWF